MLWLKIECLKMCQLISNSEILLNIDSSSWLLSLRKFMYCFLICDHFSSGRACFRKKSEITLQTSSYSSRCFKKSNETISLRFALNVIR